MIQIELVSGLTAHSNNEYTELKFYIEARHISPNISFQFFFNFVVYQLAFKTGLKIWKMGPVYNNLDWRKIHDLDQMDFSSNSLFHLYLSSFTVWLSNMLRQNDLFLITVKPINTEIFQLWEDFIKYRFY